MIEYSVNMIGECCDWVVSATSNIVMGR